MTAPPTSSPTPSSPSTGPSPPVLGILPGGTGCDLLRTFALPQKLEAAATHLATDSTYLIDVGRLEGEFGVRHFLNVAQAGVGAAAAETAPGWNRGWGMARYPLAFLRVCPAFPPPRSRSKVTTAGASTSSTRAKALAVIFANAQYFAGGWNVAPRANLTDGRLDVQVIDTRKRRAPGPGSQDHPWRPPGRSGRASVLHGANLDLQTDPIWPIEADGDPIGNTPVRVSVLPGALLLKI